MFQFSTSNSVNEAVQSNRHKPISGLSKSEKRQITRNRTSYSCATCRRRKVKCDKTRPICGGCEKAGEQCLYSDDVVALNAQAPTSNHEASPAWKKRKSVLDTTDPVEVSASVLDQANSLSGTDLKAIEEQLQRLTQMVDILRSSNANGDNLQLKDLLTPARSASDSGSDVAQPRSGLGLDMFQLHNSVPAREAADLSTPLSTLTLDKNGDRLSRIRDPFWSHISDELDQLNHLMRRRDNTHAVPADPDSEQAAVPRNQVPAEEPIGHENDDSSESNDFHKEAGILLLENSDPDSCDVTSRLLAFSKSGLLQGIPIECSTAAAVHHIAQALPTRAQSNVLFRCWLTGVYPVVGIFMPSEISEKHEEFWNRIERTGISDLNNFDLDCLTALYSIWYAGSLSISSNMLRYWFPNTSRAQLCVQFHDHTVFCLLLGSIRRDINLYKLAALVLLQSMPISEEDPTQGSLYLGLIVRLAFNIGLHREPTLFQLSVAEEGMRRRLWWQIIQLDIFNVVATGYPSQISERFCDTRVVCEDRDAFTSDNVQIDGSPERKASEVSQPRLDVNGGVPESTSFRTGSLLARGKSIMACALRSVVSLHLDTKRLRNEDVNEMKRIMTEAEGHIHEIIKSIPSKGLPEMGFVPEVSRKESNRALENDPLLGIATTPNDVAYYKSSTVDADPSWPLAQFYRQKQVAYNKWARISLSMLADKMHCVAYAPFLKNTKSKLWGLGRQCALHNCHSFLRKFNSVASDPDLEPFRWGWPSLYGPLQPVLIMLVDLYERPNSVEAPRSRELVDMVFAMAAPESGIIGGPDGVTVQRPLREGGVEVWDMLRGLRSAAWQKARLDSTVLWTEEDQLVVGAATPLSESQRIAQSLREDYIHGKPKSPPTGPYKSCTCETEQGVRHMVDLAYADLTYDSPSSVEERLRNADKQSGPSNGGQREGRCAGGRGLLRRQGQMKMPFPLTQHMERCSGHVAATNASPDHVFKMHTHMPKPEGATRVCSGQMTTLLTEAAAKKLLQPTENNAHIPQQYNHAETIPYNMRSNGAVNDAGITNGHGNHGASYQDEQPHESQNGNGLHRSDTDMELGFDWEKWDAVFGQYTGFTEVMEDSDAWTSYVN